MLPNQLCSSRVHTNNTHRQARRVQSTSSFLSCCAAALTSSTCSMPVYQHVWHLVCLDCSPIRARVLSHAFFVCHSNEHCLPLSSCAFHTSSASLTSSLVFCLSHEHCSSLSCAASPSLSHTLTLFLSLADYAKTGTSCAQTTTNRRHSLCLALFAVAVSVAASLSCCCSPWGEHKANCAQQNQSSSEKVVSVAAEKNAVANRQTNTKSAKKKEIK